MQVGLITELKKEVSQLKATLNLQQQLIDKHNDDLKAKDTIIQSLRGMESGTRGRVDKVGVAESAAPRI